MKNKKGFTLIEFAIVIFIFVILAAVIIPSYCDYRGRASVAGALSEAAAAKNEVLGFVSQNERLPTKEEFTVLTAKLPKYKGLESINWHPQQSTLILKLTEKVAEDTDEGQYLALSLIKRLGKQINPNGVRFVALNIPC